MGKSDLKVYLVLLVAASAAEDVGEDYDYLYSDFFPELSAQPSGLDTTDADSDKMHELRSVNCMAVPKLTTVHDDLGLLFRSTPLPRPPPINPRINTSGADRGLRQTQHASDFDGPKRRKKEPSRLKEYAFTETTAADSEDCSDKNDS
eukprot:XP_016657518.1 PREDICTED: uncharacterized protein LOC100569354 [Acyrthosiphon pisum]